MPFRDQHEEGVDWRPVLDGVLYYSRAGTHSWRCCSLYAYNVSNDQTSWQVHSRSGVNSMSSELGGVLYYDAASTTHAINASLRFSLGQHIYGTQTTVERRGKSRVQMPPITVVFLFTGTLVLTINTSSTDWLARCSIVPALPSGLSFGYEQRYIGPTS